MRFSWTSAQCAWLSWWMVKHAAQRVLEPHVVDALVHRLLDEQRGHRGERRDTPGELERAIRELVSREDLADHPEAVRLVDIDARHR